MIMQNLKYEICSKLYDQETECYNCLALENNDLLKIGDFIFKDVETTAYITNQVKMEIKKDYAKSKRQNI